MIQKIIFGRNISKVVSLVHHITGKARDVCLIGDVVNPHLSSSVASVTLSKMVSNETNFTLD